MRLQLLLTLKARILSILASLALTAAVSAQSTAFTYQGRLKNGAALAAGLHDFRFTLFDAASGGVALGSPQCVDNLSVVEGLFSATIDFGPQFATTAARFLQVEVRADTGLSCAYPAGFVVLGPRQPLSAAPIASHANTAFSLAAPDGSTTNAVSVGNGGKVGIGTTTPSTLLHVASAANPVLVLQDTGPASAQSGSIRFWNGYPTETAWVGFGTPGSPDLSVVNARPGGNIVLSPVSGSVGIGTTTPAATLDVRGDIRLGSSSQVFALGGEENLRIVRGTVNGAGGIVRGTGFTVVRVSSGDFEITFTTPFLSEPSVTATVDDNVESFEFDDFYVAGIFSPTTTSVRVRTRLHQGGFAGPISQKFHFCAIGPRLP